MDTPTIHDLANACKIFMGLAYPDGLESIPDAKRSYITMGADGAIADFLPPSPCSIGICQDLSKVKGAGVGFEFRLGSACHPHLKLRAQRIELHGRPVWVFSVDTHDRFALQAVKHLSGAEAEAWRVLLEKNSTLKKQVEAAFADAGLYTPTSILKVDLT